MDINKASSEDLERAFQVDGTRADYLIRERTKLGGFKSWEDVKRVPGFEDKMVENLEAAGLTIGGGQHRPEHQQEDRNTEKARGGSSSGSGRSNSESSSESSSGSSSESSSGSSSSRSNRGTLDVNSASAEDLERVFEMDGERARYLIDSRNRLGGFRSWEQIKSEVPSFDDGMIENLKKAGATLGNNA